MEKIIVPDAFTAQEIAIADTVAQIRKEHGDEVAEMIVDRAHADAVTDIEHDVTDIAKTHPHFDSTLRYGSWLEFRVECTPGDNLSPTDASRMLNEWDATPEDDRMDYCRKGAMRTMQDQIEDSIPFGNRENIRVEEFHTQDRHFLGWLYNRGQKVPRSERSFLEDWVHAHLQQEDAGDGH